MAKTLLLYLTEGMLLREMLAYALLHSYCVVMVDEVHERSVNTDILLGLLKKVAKKRLELRLITSSATLDALELRDYFDLTRHRRRRRKVEGSRIRCRISATICWDQPQLWAPPDGANRSMFSICKCGARLRERLHRDGWIWANERRVALTPTVTTALVKRGFTINIEPGAGIQTRFRD